MLFHIAEPVATEDAEGNGAIVDACAHLSCLLLLTLAAVRRDPDRPRPDQLPEPAHQTNPH